MFPTASHLHPSHHSSADRKHHCGEKITFPSLVDEEPNKEKKEDNHQQQQTSISPLPKITGTKPKEEEEVKSTSKEQKNDLENVQPPTSPTTHCTSLTIKKTKTSTSKQVLDGDDHTLITAADHHSLIYKMDENSLEENQPEQQQQLAFMHVLHSIACLLFLMASARHIWFHYPFCLPLT